MPAPLVQVKRILNPSAALLSISLLLTLSPVLRAEEPRTHGITANSLRRTPIVDVIEKNKAAVVNIHSERTITRGNGDVNLEFMQTQQRVNGMGTGVVIDPRGYVVTNYHVVDDVQTLRVRLHDGTTLTARVVARDPAEDLAILKIDPAKPLQTVTLGTASDLLLGETVIAIGNAFGYEHTVTTGVVSALKRDVNLNKDVSYKSLIQTDASINPGNSGGPLFNINGELIGINVAIRAGAQGIGFAIPVDTMIRVAADLLSVKRRSGICHGLTIRDAVDCSEIPMRRWAVVEKVDASSPAAKAGLHAGDVLESVGDQKIVAALDFERAFLDRPVGEKLNFGVRRGASGKGEGGEVVRGEIALKSSDKIPALLPADLVWKKLGLKVQVAAPEQVTKANPQLHGGLLVTEVNEDTVASKAGFQRGDILIGLHQWETITIENVTFVLNHPDLSSFSPIRFFRIRGGQLQRGWLPNIE